MFPLDHAHHPAPLRFAVRAERTRLTSTGAITAEVEVYLRLERQPNGQTFVRMDGGSTGREGFQLTAQSLAEVQRKCWVACAGSAGWDRIVVPAHEMRAFFSRLGVDLPPEAEAA